MNTRTCLVMLAALLLSGCKDSKEPVKQQPVSVRTMMVETQPTDGSRTYPGTLEETTGTVLSFNVSGALKSINVSTGARVSKGQLIAVVDDATLKNSHDIALSTLSQAEDAYKRMKQLHDAGSLPDIQWVEVQSKLNQAQSAERIARKNVQDCRLYAPFSGFIADKNVEAGQNVLPGAPVVKLVKTQHVKVKVAVPENEISQIRIGGSVSVCVQALGGKTFTGRIVEKGVEANPVTRSYEVKALLENNGGELLPGMVCDVAFTGCGQAERSIIIPANIVQIDKDNKTFVWTNQNGKAHKCVISTGMTTNAGVVVLSGLLIGDSLIVEGQQKVSEGTALTIEKK